MFGRRSEKRPAGAGKVSAAGGRVTAEALRVDPPSAEAEPARLQRRPVRDIRLTAALPRRFGKRKTDVLRELFRAPNTMPVFDEDELQTLLSYCREDRGMSRRLKKRRLTAREMERLIRALEEDPRPESRGGDAADLIKKLALCKARLQLKRACRF